METEKQGLSNMLDKTIGGVSEFRVGRGACNWVMLPSVLRNIMKAMGTRNMHWDLTTVKVAREIEDQLQERMIKYEEEE